MFKKSLLGLLSFGLIALMPACKHKEEGHHHHHKHHHHDGVSQEANKEKAVKQKKVKKVKHDRHEEKAQRSDKHAIVDAQEQEAVMPSDVNYEEVSVEVNEDVLD